MMAMRTFTWAPQAARARLAGADQSATDLPEGSLRDRMVPPMPPGGWRGWAGPLAVTVFGGILRFYRLGVPHAMVFDETYYASDAYGILRHGVEMAKVTNHDTLILRGSTHIFATGASYGGEYVAHPPLGKVMIAAGEWMFGLTPFGWRFAVALVGTLAILMTARIARRMTRSTLLGSVAGLLLALDGLELVMSRTALLDIFVMFWVLAAFGMLVLDRDASRALLAAAAGSGDFGPGLGIRWRRVLAGVFLGLACASKWEGVWFIPAFAAMALAWDVGARRAAGYRSWALGAVGDAGWLPVTFVAVPFAAYLASWSGWFASGLGWGRNWAATNGNHVPVWSALDSWYQYQRSMYQFGIGLHVQGGYTSRPWTWFYLGRPTSMYWAAPKGCGPGGCAQEVLAQGTPAIWWASMGALAFCLGWWIVRRDWRAGAVLVGVAAGWLPWVWFALHDNRTEYFFYAVVFVPFLVIAITLCLGLIIGPARADPVRRAVGAVVAGAYLIVVLVNFAYLYPVLTAQVISFSAWHARMMYTSWV
jgi:dolichyl-phosphate-mannose--protein O-mannosyl transferase